MPKWVKMLIALALLPVCAGAGLALWKVLQAAGWADTVLVPFLAGAVCWVVIFLLLPKPMWIYVFGHELTHALWTWLFGGRVKRFKASANGGHVVITRTNFLIALAPYFFPLYVVLLIAAFFVGHLIWDWARHLVWLHLLLGAAYAFHVTLTWTALKTTQTDITSQGWLFSAVVIYLGNVVILLFGLPLLTAKGSLFSAAGWWWEGTGEVLRWIGRLR